MGPGKIRVTQSTGGEFSEQTVALYIRDVDHPNNSFIKVSPVLKHNVIDQEDVRLRHLSQGDPHPHQARLLTRLLLGLHHMLAGTQQ